MMKREREGDHHGITMANYLMLLSRGGEFTTNSSCNNNNSNNRVFECKTCNRQFPSFQALGGHRASHKKLRLMGESNSDDQKMMLHGSAIITKAKTHECSICGMEFAIGQALGGHMRRHRTAAARGTLNKGNMHNFINSSATTTSSGSGCSTVDNNFSANRNTTWNTKRLVLFPDLNLTPIENDLEILKIGRPTPLVDCFN